MPNRTLVIAEPGCTHEGRWEDMARLFEVARDAGADVFKPQYTSNPAKMCERRHIGTDHPKRSYYEQAYGWNSYPIAWLEQLAEMCKAAGMQLACTSFLPEDVWRVDPYVSMHKVSSFEQDDPCLKQTAFATGQDVIISHGMKPSSHQDRDGFYKVYHLHCTTAYPAPAKAMHLHAIREFGFRGLSDHSRRVLTGAVAVGAGARMIETHIRLDDTSPDNPDYPAALSPAEFVQYVANVREAEDLMGESVGKGIVECEEWALPYRVKA